MRQRKKCTNRMTTTSRSFPPRDYPRRSHPRAFRRPSFQRAYALARQKSNFQAIPFPSDYSSFSKGPVLVYAFIAANIIPRPAPLSSPLRKKFNIPTLFLKLLKSQQVTTWERLSPCYSCEFSPSKDTLYDTLRRIVPPPTSSNSSGMPGGSNLSSDPFAPLSGAALSPEAF